MYAPSEKLNADCITLHMQLGVIQRKYLENKK